MGGAETGVGRGRGRPIQGKILEYFSGHPGEMVFVKTMAEELQETEQRVRSGVYSLATRKDLPIETIARGYTWIYRPNGKTAGPPVEVTVHTPKKPDTLYRLLGGAKDGSFILERDDGALFRAVEL